MKNIISKNILYALAVEAVIFLVSYFLIKWDSHVGVYFSGLLHFPSIFALILFTGMTRGVEVAMAIVVILQIVFLDICVFFF